MLLQQDNGINGIVRVIGGTALGQGRVPPSYVEAALTIISPSKGIPSTGKLADGTLVYPNISRLSIAPPSAMFMIFPP